jgi:arginine/lysine/ornithine decarboxylase
MNHQTAPLFEALKDYHERQVIPFDVPGHKHGRGLQAFGEFFGEKVLEVDVNSMKCLDNLSHPSGVIREAEELLADAYGVDYGFFMVNGTSSAVQAMVMSLCRPGEKLLLPRNAHKSATNAIILSGAIPAYIQPEINVELGIAMGVTLKAVKEGFEQHPDAKGVFVINPTYFGAASELKAIIDYAHGLGKIVVVDEAHGAHFHFHPELPASAASLGADLVAVSIHKTGGSLTQSSALLINEGLLDRQSVRTMINLTQTTSASYLLMTSLDMARRNLVLNGPAILSNVLSMARDAKRRINEIDGYYAFGSELIGTPGVVNFDDTKLTVKVTDLGLTGFEVYDILRDEYNIQMELGDTNNILGIMSLGDTQEHVDAVIDALKDISKRFFTGNALNFVNIPMMVPETVLSPREAFYSSKVSLPLRDAVGKISGESLMAYPPGIPIVTPGELITSEMIDYIEFLKGQNTLLTDLADDTIEHIRVIR